MAEEFVQYARKDKVAVLRLDDGKANALAPPVLDALHEGLDRAVADEAGAIVLLGRPGRFSAGFDLSVMRQGPEAVAGMVGRGAELAYRVFDCPLPFVIGATGHALAMGAVLLLSADERIGAEGDFKIGLNEVAIKMTLPEFGIALAEERLSRRHLQRAVSQAEVYAPLGAVDAGYLDRVVPPGEVEPAAIARAQALADTLDPKAHRETKRALRRATLERLRAALEPMGISV
jgi:enoyl-CoA hydratase